ncbi:hypothetical protein [Microbacterium sp. 179-I 3D3 NHS]|uniref:hypothetical protein n=1 Tax=Microbacterium sp. 179-I 3D3 NHS TaxID=3142382 RepID=UPI0039A3ADD2
MRRPLRTLFAALAGTALALGGTTAALAQTTAEVSASPASIQVGEKSTITATGLGDLTTATFGLDATPGGELSADGGAPAASVEVTVSGGRASAEFSATEAGTFTVAVTNGETPLGTTTVTVTGGGGSGGSVAEVSASPADVDAGETATVTAKGLGELSTVTFGLDDTPGGELSAAGGQPSSSVRVNVEGGTATAEFTATEAGTFTVAVSDGETVLGTTTVTVSAPAPSVEPTPTATTDTDGGSGDGALIAIIVILAVLVVAAIVTLIVIARRRRSGTGTPGADSAAG